MAQSTFAFFLHRVPLLSVLLLTLVASCGGGGNGNTPSGDLQVLFSGYVATPSTTYKEVTFAPSVTDLNGNRPSYGVASGSLPAGLSLNSSTGVISGVLAGSGATSAQIELTVQGFKGSLSVTFAMSVSSPFLSYTGSAGSSFPIPATTFDVGAPLPTFRVYLLDPAVLSNGGYGLGPLEPGRGVTITYRVASGSALPAGLSLDPNTGAITGSPAIVGDVTTQVQAAVTYAGATQTYTTTIPFSITTPHASLAYTPTTINGDLCVTLLSAPGGGAPLTLTPVLTGTLPGDVLSNFTATPAAGLMGLMLDPDTGVISGSSFASVVPCSVVASQFDLTYTLTRGAYSTQLSRHIIFFQ
jgi:hypothetical protein